MQKKFIVLIMALILFTGCDKIDGNDSHHVDYVVSCLGNKSYVNSVAVGYKYYLPKGVKLVNDFDYNQKFLFDDVNLYMFVDVNSYYYKTDMEIKHDNDDYYFQRISYAGKSGYLKIRKDGDKYFTRLLYNYAKMEFYSDKEDINKLLTISAIILNSIRYNRVVIENILDDSLGTSREVTYEIEKPMDAKNSFSQYLEEYVTEEDEKEELPD